MATKKQASKKAVKEKSTMIKIAEKVGEIAGRIVNEKDHLVQMAGGAIESVKTAVQHITAKKKPTTKKLVKKAAKKVVKKAIKPAVKKVKKAVAKKKPAVKKVVKKTVKKVAAKKR